MQMEKNECHAKDAQPPLSKNGITFRPEEINRPVEVQPGSSNLSELSMPSVATATKENPVALKA